MPRKKQDILSFIHRFSISYCRNYVLPYTRNWSPIRNQMLRKCQSGEMKVAQCCVLSSAVERSAPSPLPQASHYSRTILNAFSNSFRQIVLMKICGRTENAVAYRNFLIWKCFTSSSHFSSYFPQSRYHFILLFSM